MKAADWICCHLGAREHYAVPRALARVRRLRALITDAWVRPGTPLAQLPAGFVRRLAERGHADLGAAEVREFTLSLLAQEVEWRLQRKRGWDLMIARNEWFQRRAAEALPDLGPASGSTTVFAHSYSALEIFRSAKARGWTTVLGQIDPGEEHFNIVRRLSDAAPQYGPPPPAPPAGYFVAWREECALADRIVVNSEWSREAVIKSGVDGGKIRVQAIPYEDHAVPAAPDAPDGFSAGRPLRLLFVGSLTVAKGVPELLRAMALLADAPVTLTLVGPLAMVLPPDARLPSIRVAGSVPRGEVARYYAAGDVLVFPSHSDGFGMAQIEARAAGLPIIASRHCGRVVEDGVTGALLPEVTAEAIARAVGGIVSTPRVLREWSAAMVRAERPTLESFGRYLSEVAAT
jgi:glycosyltransferase involved in cell wall biosynthesis